jgi:hypothetical protein
MIPKKLIWSFMLEFTQNEAQGVKKTYLKHHSQILHEVLKKNANCPVIQPRTS